MAASPLYRGAHTTVIDDLFSAGPRVAFHVTQRGSYVGGLGLPAAAVGREATLYSTGVVERGPGGDWRGRVIRERAALERALHADAS